MSPIRIALRPRQHLRTRWAGGLLGLCMVVSPLACRADEASALSWSEARARQESRSPFWRRAERVAVLGLAFGEVQAGAAWPRWGGRADGLARLEGERRTMDNTMVGPVWRDGARLNTGRLIGLQLGFTDATPTQAMAAYAAAHRLQGGSRMGAAGALALSAAAGAVWTTSYEGARLSVIPAVGPRQLGIGVAASW